MFEFIVFSNHDRLWSVLEKDPGCNCNLDTENFPALLSIGISNLLFQQRRNASTSELVRIITRLF